MAPIEDHEALDAALDAYIAEVHEVASVIGLKAPGVDFASEVARINAAKAEMDAKLAELRGDVPAVEAEPDAGDTGEPAEGADAGDAAVTAGDAGAGDAAAGDAAGEPVNTTDAAGEPAASAGDSPTV